MEIVFKNAVINIETYTSSSHEEKADIVISDENEPDKKSIIEVRIGSSKCLIAFFWSHFSHSTNVSLHWAEETSVLFIGAGTLSAVINPISKTLIDIQYPELFWSWECIKDYILELGELECRLYKPSGELVGSTAVDPPYEYQLTKNAIVFSSIVIGETKIEFT